MGDIWTEDIVRTLVVNLKKKSDIPRLVKTFQEKPVFVQHHQLADCKDTELIIFGESSD